MTNQNSFAILSHYPRSQTTGVAATVHNVFLGPRATFKEVRFLDIHRSPAAFLQQLTEALDESRTLLFNGCFSLLNANAHIALEMARQRHAQVVVYWHETAFNMRLAGPRLPALADELCAPNVQHWAVCSQSKQLVMYLLGCSFEDVLVVYEALELPSEPPTSRHRSTGDIQLYGAGHVIDFRKGIDYFIEISKSLTTLDGRRCHYQWFGNTQSTAMHHGAVDRGRVDFPGHVNDLRAELTKADGFLLTSRDDPAPLVALEALACDLPVFCFDATGIVEIVPPAFVAGCAAEMVDNVTAYWQNRQQYPPGFFLRLAQPLSTQAFVRRISRSRRLLRADADIAIPGWALQRQVDQRPAGSYLLVATAPKDQIEAALTELPHPPVAVLAGQQLGLDAVALGQTEILRHRAPFVSPALLADPAVTTGLKRLGLTGCLVLFNRARPRDYGAVMQLVDQLGLAEVWGRTPAGEYYRLLPSAAAVASST